MGLSGQALENLHQMMKRGGGKLNNRRYSVNRMTGAVPQKKMGVGMLEQVVTHQCASEACRYMWSLCSCCCVCVLCVCERACMNVCMAQHADNHSGLFRCCRLMVKGSFKQRSAEKKSNDATQNAAKSIVLQKTATEIRELAVAAKHNLLF